MEKGWGNKASRQPNGKFLLQTKGLSGSLPYGIKTTIFRSVIQRWVFCSQCPSKQGMPIQAPLLPQEGGEPPESANPIAPGPLLLTAGNSPRTARAIP